MGKAYRTIAERPWGLLGFKIAGFLRYFCCWSFAPLQRRPFWHLPQRQTERSPLPLIDSFTATGWNAAEIIGYFRSACQLQNFIVEVALLPFATADQLGACFAELRAPCVLLSGVSVAALLLTYWPCLCRIFVFLLWPSGCAWQTSPTAAICNFIIGAVAIL